MHLRIKTPKCSIIILLVFINTFSLLAHAQEASAVKRNSYLWLNGGLGFGTYGLAGGLSLSFQIGHFILTPRVAGTAEILMEGDDVFDFGLTVGYSTKKPRPVGYFSIAGGISYVTGMSRSSYESVSTVGFPIDIQIFVTPLSFAGIGFQGAADINSQRSFWCLLLCLQIGKLR